MAMYSIRSERAFCERLNYDLLFKWFLDMRIDQPAFDATTFSKNRKRLLDHEVADEFFAAVVRQRSCAATCRRITSPSTARCWRRGRRTRASNPKTARRRSRRPDATSKSTGMARNGRTTPTCRRRSGSPAVSQVVATRREAVLFGASVDGEPQRVDRRCRVDHRGRLRRTGDRVEMLARLPATTRRRTVAGDKAYDTREFIAEARELGFTPHVAQNTTVDDDPRSMVERPAIPAMW